MRQLYIEHQEREDVDILAVSGHMDDAELLRLKNTVDRLLAKNRSRVILNFYGLLAATSLSFAGLVVYAESFRARGGQLKVAGLSREITRIVRILRLGERIECYPDVASALHSTWGASACVREGATAS